MASDAFASVRPKLRLLLSARGDNDEGVLSKIAGEPAAMLIFMPLGSCAMQQLVVEEDDSYIPVTDVLLAEWNVSAEQVADHALDAMTRMGSGLDIGRLEDGLLGVEGVDPAIAALVFSMDLHERLEGTPVMLATDTSTVVIADAEKPAEMDALLTRATDAADAEDALPPVPLVRVAGEWQDHEPADGELSLAFRNLKVRWAESEYARQEALIQRLGLNAAAAPFDVHDVDGTLVTATTWIDGVPTLLPQADLVTLGVREGDGVKRIGSVRLSKLKSAVKLSDLMLCPTRYFCTAHPDANVLAPLMIKNG